MTLDISRYFTTFVPKKDKTVSKTVHVPINTSHEPQSSIRQTTILHTRRKEDMSAEAQLGIFLDKYLYDRFPTKKLFDEINRVYDKDRQLQGIDVQFKSKNGLIFNIDEKAQLYYINKNIPTFAFEISFLRKCGPTVGWLCNDSLKTNMYLLIWPFADCDNCNGISWRDFTKAECFLIEKKKIIDFLETHGLTKDVLLKDAQQIRNNKKYGKIPIPNLQGIYYYASDPSKYKEAPINIVIAKGLLKTLTQRRYIVTPTGVDTI